MTKRKASALQVWWNIASEGERNQLANWARTTPEYIRHLAKQYGNRRPRLGLAVKIENGTKVLHAKNKKLPVVTVAELAS